MISVLRAPRTNIIQDETKVKADDILARVAQIANLTPLIPMSNDKMKLGTEHVFPSSPREDKRKNPAKELPPINGFTTNSQVSKRRII